MAGREESSAQQSLQPWANGEGHCANVQSTWHQLSSSCQPC